MHNIANDSASLDIDIQKDDYLAKQGSMTDCNGKNGGNMDIEPSKQQERNDNEPFLSSVLPIGQNSSGSPNWI